MSLPSRIRDGNGITVGSVVQPWLYQRKAYQQYHNASQHPAWLLALAMEVVNCSWLNTYRTDDEARHLRLTTSTRLMRKEES